MLISHEMFPGRVHSPIIVESPMGWGSRYSLTNKEAFLFVLVIQRNLKSSNVRVIFTVEKRKTFNIKYRHV